MKIYYYNTIPIKKSYDEWKRKQFPGHLLYGLTHFEKYGIECILHPYRHFDNRILLMIYTLWKIITCKQSFEGVYATSYRGIELVIFLRALGLYKKPIFIWHHQAIPVSSNLIKNKISRLFYKGLDELFFFSQPLIEISLRAGKVKKEKLHLIHWGADLDFYDSLTDDNGPEVKTTFISTGKENRDFVTLINAFTDTSAPLNIYTEHMVGNKNYKKLFEVYFKEFPSNIHLNFEKGLIPHKMALKVVEASVVTICCLDYPYTVGLTTIVEALALGKPILCSKNPYYEMNIEKEKVGITIDYYDTEQWKKAIQYIIDHPEEAKEMGKRGRRLAQKKYNLELYSKELAQHLLRYQL